MQGPPLPVAVTRRSVPPRPRSGLAPRRPQERGPARSPEHERASKSSRARSTASPISLSPKRSGPRRPADEHEPVGDGSRSSRSGSGPGCQWLAPRAHDQLSEPVVEDRRAQPAERRVQLADMGRDDDPWTLTARSREKQELVALPVRHLVVPLAGPVAGDGLARLLDLVALQRQERLHELRVEGVAQSARRARSARAIPRA